MVHPNGQDGSEQGRNQPNTAERGLVKKFQVESNIYHLLKVWSEK